MERAWAAYLKNEKELFSVSSGGAATALSRQMLRKGGCVIGVRYSEDFRFNRYCAVWKEEELEFLKGSKYGDVNIRETDKNSLGGGHLFDEVKKILEKNELLFIGLPCVVAGLKSYLRDCKGNEHLTTIALICHGPSPSIVQEQYVSYLEKKYKSRLIAFSVRHKKQAWLPVYLYAEFENGKKFCEKFYDTEFGFAFTVYGKKACYSCKYKGKHRMEDLTIGDFWGIETTDIPYSEKGTSVVISRTSKGEEFLMDNKEMEIYACDMKDVINGNPRLVSSKDKHKEYDKFEKLIKKKGLIYAVKHCSFRWKKIKRLIPVEVKKCFLRCFVHL